jgi:hypothetical protein
LLKLKNIISHLEESLYKTIEESLKKNKAENSLFLLVSYKKNINDSIIINELKLSANSFYVLKSRLYDKVQSHLSGEMNVTREELIKKLDTLPQMCFTEPREVIIPYLEKMESDLLKYDMHRELLTVYSIFKKINLFSDKYFYYSQLYNKHIAYSLSIEKSEEILGNFNRKLGQYHFSRALDLKDELLFIKKEINVQHDLNPSRQIKIIKNIINLQLYLFCEIDSVDNSNIEELLRETIRIIDELPESSIYKYWTTALDFLSFEYYFKIGRKEQAAVFYDSVNCKLQSILLYTNVCCTPIFLISKLAFIQETGRLKELLDIENPNKNIEINDTHSSVCVGIYDAMVYYHKNNLKDATNCLQQLINENSFKDYFHINIEIKFTLAVFYLQLNEFEMALSILKSIYRKIKLDKLDNYQNALSLIKVLEQEANNKSGKVTAKQKDDFLLFIARNKNECEILKHLSFTLTKKYS